MSSRQIRLLLVEDHESDAQMVTYGLRQDGLRCKYKRVDSQHDIKKAMGDDSWEAILCDYTLPGFNALDVLKIVRSIDKNVPFIVVSSTIGEQTAVKLMRAGAHDYIMKDNLSRLAPVIEREIREALVRREAKKKQIELAQSEIRYRQIVQGQTEFIIRWRPDGMLTFVNASYCRHFKKAQNDILMKSNFFEHVLEQDLARFKQKMAALSPHDPTFTDELQVELPKGKRAWYQWVNHALYTNDGQFVEYQSVGRDISELKLTLEELQKTNLELEQLKKRLQAENIYLQEEIKLTHNFKDIIGNSQTLKRTLRKVEQVAPENSTILLLGETGTGKELIARAIHSLSARSKFPFVKLNCATLPENLTESELFGHEKGAFTGATAQKIGRFELADSGTLLLDEIADLPLPLQAKLLRVLQEGEFERVGGMKTFKVDVRIIAATNQDLEQAVQENRFREDLFYRINVFPIELPPLRERIGDIPMLANHFCQQYNDKQKKAIKAISKKMMDVLIAYHWPGNIRELENIIERSVILTQGSELDCTDFMKQKKSPSNLKNSLKEVERDHIIQILEACSWIIEGNRGAAKRLQLHPSTLRDRMRNLGIKRKSPA